jgi:hypothetical protein
MSSCPLPSSKFLIAWNAVKRVMSRHTAIEQAQLLRFSFKDNREFLLQPFVNGREEASIVTFGRFFRNRPKLEQSASQNITCNDP